MTTRRRGFILATTLLVMTLLTVMLMAGFVLISAEFRTTNGSYSNARSMDLAQAGLQSYFSNAHTLNTGSDSTNYTFPGGYAMVLAQRLRDSTVTDRAVWIVYSTGVDSTRSLIANGTGKRVVAQIALFSAGSMPVRAAMVAANGVQMTGSGNQPINGTNFNTSVAGCTQVGAAGNTTGLTTAYGGYTAGGAAAPTGGVDSMTTAAKVNDSTHIDWAKLVAGEFTPDFYNQLPAGPYPNTNYQTYYYPNPAGGNVTIPANQYRGLLVVNGDVTLSAGAHWDGIIVAGGRLTTAVGPSTYTLHGTIITGLNIVLGQTVNRNMVDRGANFIQFDWCYTRSSMISLSYLVPVKGAYLDTWKTY